MEGAAVGSLVARTIRPVADKFSSLLTSEVTQIWDLDDGIRQLKSKLGLIDAFLDDAGKKQFENKAVEAWVGQLKQIAYDAEDVIETFSAMQPRTVSLRLCPPVLGCARSVWVRREISRRMEDVNVRFAAIDDDRKRLDIKISDKAESSDRRLETASLPEKRVFGREKQKEGMIEKLLQPDDGLVHLIPILGMGGIGKTTLAQVVFHDPRVEQHFPGIRKWVFVGEKFDSRGLITKIIDKKKPLDRRGNPIENPTLDDLQNALRDELKDNRFLVVLDDVWNRNHNEWENLWRPLSHGGVGGKVVVTARDKTINWATTTSVCFDPLPPLSEDDCWSIFKMYAFADRIPDIHLDMESVRKEMVKKFKGVPLAAKIAGGFMRNASKDMWETILRQNEMWPLTQDESDILPVLRWSYQFLPAHLKKCFSFCSIFPKNHRFHSTKMVHIWMALDLIRPQNNWRIEDIGISYFNELVNRSLFQQHVNKGYVMHDLIHDLAQSVSTEECLIAGEENPQIDCEKVRHLSFYDNATEMVDFSTFYIFKKLRTFIHNYELNVVPFDFIPHSFFDKLSYIRVLDLSTSNIQKLPKSFGSLRRLRYLDLTSTGILSLPKAICSLSGLQTMILGEDHCKLPKGMSRLVNLRHLEADIRDISNIANVGKLTSLQELKAFSIKRKNGHKLDELKNMKQLRKLCLWNLENVENSDDAKHANLKEKLRLCELELSWSKNPINSRERRTAKEVLEGLQPPLYITDIKIQNYYGLIQPKWMSKDLLSNYSHLVFIGLYKCRSWTTLPLLGQLLSLKHLEVGGFDELEKVGNEFYGSENDNSFPFLETLVFEDMGKWKEWAISEKGQFLGSLQVLKIRGCPMLKEMPDFPPTLSDLEIINVGLHNLPGLWGCSPADQSNCSCLSSLVVVNCPNLRSLSSLLQHHLNHLSKIIIETCEELTYFYEDERFGVLDSLKEIRIKECRKLLSLPVDAIVSFTSLSSLEISGFPNLFSLPNMLTGCLMKLERLNIENCAKLTSLSLQGLKLVRIVSIKNCVELSSFLVEGPMPLTCLKSLEISGCPQIVSLPKEVLCRLINLEKLNIKNCVQLKYVHFQVLSLNMLCIDDCRRLELKNEVSSEGQDNNQSPFQILSLKNLETNNKTLLDWLLPQRLEALEILLIDGCAELTSFSEEGWQNLRSLQKLYIYRCANLESLPQTLGNLIRLEELHIISCPRIKKLPDTLPMHLGFLWIHKCADLKKSCRGKGSPDWHKVSQVQELYVE